MPSHHVLSPRRLLGVSALAVVAAGLVGWAHQPAGPSAPTPEGHVRSADEALSRLLEGNRRYAANQSAHVNQSESRRRELIGGQQPFATIFGCVDSRVPPELIFDRGLGDLFVIRTAGHVLDDAVLGSLEFGVAELRIPLLVVLGHERCGAVKATLDVIDNHATPEAEIGVLVEGIRPALEQARGAAGDLVDNTVRANIALTVNRLRGLEFFEEAIEKGSLKILGARYDLDQGTVEITMP